VAIPVAAFLQAVASRYFMINPYACYAAAFAIAILSYSLGWSDLYPALRAPLFIFLMLTVAAHAGLSFYWNRRIHVFRSAEKGILNPVSTTIFIYALWTADFIYEGGIPLFKILMGQPYNYKLFGIPSVHVFTVTFASFFTVYLFSLFVNSRNRIYLMLYGINLLAALLIYSRAMLIFNIAGSVFVFFLTGYTLTWRRLALTSGGLVLLIYFFGVLGTVRVSAEAGRSYDPGIFLGIGNATAGFRTSPVPPEFFWGYVYLSSPLANLQQNINTFHVAPSSGAQFARHVNNEMLLDFISKRVNRVFNTSRERENTLPKKPFNVSTVYSRSYSYQGWTGMVIMAIFVLIFPLAYMKLVPSNQYTLTGVAVLSTMYLFLFYDNTLRFTGLGLQLIYPFVLPVVEKVTAVLQKRTMV
jgi:hypothetical protein